jgi:hypothetical protein
MAAETKREISMRPFRLGDEQGILDLFKAAFERDKDPEIWQWFYRKGPWGEGLIEVAECDGQIMGFYGGLPGKLRIGDETVLGLQSTDTMIHPDFRNLRTFLALARQAYARFAQQGVRVVYGFPNKAIAKVRKMMLNWTLLGDVQALELASLSAIPDISAPDGMRIIPVDRFDGGVDTLWSKVVSSKAVVRERDSAFLNWRYVDKPGITHCRIIAEDSSGALVGLAVGKVFAGDKPAADILELLTDEDAAPGVTVALTGSLLKRLAELGAGAANAWFPEEDPRHAMLRELGFAPSEFKTHFGYCFIGDADGGRRLDRWHLTMGDSDVF